MMDPERDFGLDRLFHPAVAGWFRETFREPTSPQERGWPAIASGRDVLIAAPTGTGKTLAAFLWSIDRLVREAASLKLEERVHTVYVSPLRALASDIERNLQVPLAEIERRSGLGGIRVAVRTGDTPARDRARMLGRPPHLLVTTPESLYLLLTAERSRRMIASAETVIVDEIHAVAGDKRGAHLALSLERLDRACGRRLQRIGLSATQRPIETIARLLVGSDRRTPAGRPDCAIVDEGHRREMDLSIWVPEMDLGPIATHDVWREVSARIAESTRDHRTTLVFVNTRRLSERLAHQLSGILGEGKVAPHHGSLSRPTRSSVESRLKSGELSVVVATASLELGIDVGTVDQVCHVGAPRALATLLQRVGRSGHHRTGIPKGVLFPLTRDELVQSAAAVRAVRAGALDGPRLPRAPLDILAQQAVAEAAASELGEEELWALARRAAPYAQLERKTFDQVVTMLAEGISTRRGRRSAHLHRDQVHGRLRGRRGARLAALTSGGAIPETGDYDVVEEPGETFVGRVNEDFAVESQAGDVFALGNRSWKIRRVAAGKVRVEDAHGAPPSIPFWLGEAPSRTEVLSEALSDLRREVASRLDSVGRGPVPRRIEDWLISETGLPEAGARQVVRHLAAGKAVLGTLPTREEIVAERFFDEGGGTQLVLHAPFGARVNRALGLALRKRFCRTFDFELQAAATDDGVVLSLGEQHSFPLETIFSFIAPERLEDDLVQAALATPLFANRWRWNAERSLALLRRAGGAKVPLQLLRMRAEDLLAAVFPEQVGCQDNHAGPIAVPDHPLVRETLDNCLHEAMDVEALRTLVEKIRRGEVRTRAVESPAPSVLAHEILNASPYAFLDDAPLEERRARAVALRRVVPEVEPGAGNLDPEAVETVRRESWPDVRDPDEFHDVLLGLVLLPAAETEPWKEEAQVLLETGRATWAHWIDPLGKPRQGFVATERVGLVERALAEVSFDPSVVRLLSSGNEDERPLRAIIQGWMEVLGPTTAPALAERLGLDRGEVESALASLEAAGVVFQGRFDGGERDGVVEWCDRRLLARIHRLTLGKLRREVEPVSPADLLRFLFRWQHVGEGRRLHGAEGVLEVVRQLAGFELPAAAWEGAVLPARVEGYDPGHLDRLCLSGEVLWARLTPPEGGASPDRGTTRALRAIPLALLLRADGLPPAEPSEGAPPGGAAGEVLDLLSKGGASFASDLARRAGRRSWEIEGALRELIALGLVTGDGTAGLRSLLAPRGSLRRRRRTGRSGAPLERAPSGRWSLLDRTAEDGDEDSRIEVLARRYLKRYGVVLRELLAREPFRPPWWRLVGVYRRMEARGEIRGGRFVRGFVGEQFALPEAVDSLREVRRLPALGEIEIVSAADPLNLLGVLTPGPRLPSMSRSVVAYRDGIPVATGTLGEIRSRLQSERLPPVAIA